MVEVVRKRAASTIGIERVGLEKEYGFLPDDGLDRTIVSLDTPALLIWI